MTYLKNIIPNHANDLVDILIKHTLMAFLDTRVLEETNLRFRNFSTIST